jgi:hypothetical protein
MESEDPPLDELVGWLWQLLAMPMVAHNSVAEMILLSIVIGF